MTITRANIEQEIVQRCGGLMSAAGLAVTFAGANASLNSPIGAAIRQLGGTVANISLVTDADVATVDADDLDALLAVAELRTLKNIKQNYALVDISEGPHRESLSQVIANLDSSIKALEGDILVNYNIGPNTQINIYEIKYPPYLNEEII